MRSWKLTRPDTDWLLDAGFCNLVQAPAHEAGHRPRLAIAAAPGRRLEHPQSRLARSRSASATGAGTRSETSPPKVAISLTPVEERKLKSGEAKR